jgi:hypothetical protein
MALTTEFIEKTGLAEGQVAELNTFIETSKLDATQENVLQNYILSIDADLKKKYDSKANENAEGILSGAAKRVTDLTGIQRNQGEKFADFLIRTSSEHLSKKEQALKAKEAELDLKIKNGDVSEVTRQKLDEVQKKLEALQQKEASIDEIITGDYKNKYENLTKDHESLKEKTAFAYAKPSFPKEVNAYEAAAIWKEVQSEIKDKYSIEFDSEGEAMGVDKENKFKTFKLSEIVAKNEKIVALLKGRQQEGFNHKKFDVKLEGIPFALPEKATPADIQKAIKEYLLNEKHLVFTSDEYARAFADLNVKVRKEQQKTALV